MPLFFQDNIANKKCSICGEIGGTDKCGFYIREKPNKYRNECKICLNRKCLLNYRKNIKNNRLKLKAYYHQNSEEIKEKQKLNRLNNPKKYRDRDVQRYKKDPKTYKERAKIHYHKNRECILLGQKKDRKENPEKYKLKNKLSNEKAKHDPKKVLNRRIHTLMYLSLKKNKGGRKWKTLVGYDLDQLSKHLKKTIPNGYDWNDFVSAKLHIDHIIPRSVFNYTKPEHADFKRCWELKNLQLLPAKENLLKGAKLAGHFQPSLLI